MIQAWEYVAQSVEAYPWDTTYLIGPLGLDRGQDGSHSWEPASILNATWDTPIWKANRRANFMLTQDNKAHPWLFEDAGLRLEDSAALGFKAVAVYDQAIKEGGDKIDDIRTQRDVVGRRPAQCGRSRCTCWKRWRHRMRAWFNLTRNSSAWSPDASKRCSRRTWKTRAAQQRLSQKLAEFQRDPKAWLSSNLNPQRGEHTPKGYEAFSNATMDWNVWLPPKK